MALPCGGAILWAQQGMHHAGIIRNNRKGDVVVRLSPEHAAGAACIVMEAK